MQLNSMMETVIAREVNCTIIRMDWKQVKQSTPFGTLGFSQGENEQEGNPLFGED